MGHCKSNSKDSFPLQKEQTANVHLNLIAADIYSGLYKAKKEEDVKSEK